MATFHDKSRYVHHAEVRIHETPDGAVAMVSMARPPTPVRLGTHRRRDGQRLDHLAAHYLGDPHGYWRICELEDVLFPDALAEADELEIPTSGGT